MQLHIRDVQLKARSRMQLHVQLCLLQHPHDRRHKERHYWLSAWTTPQETSALPAVQCRCLVWCLVPFTKRGSSTAHWDCKWASPLTPALMGEAVKHLTVQAGMDPHVQGDVNEMLTATLNLMAWNWANGHLQCKVGAYVHCSARDGRETLKGLAQWTNRVMVSDLQDDDVLNLSSLEGYLQKYAVNKVTASGNDLL